MITLFFIVCFCFLNVFCIPYSVSRIPEQRIELLESFEYKLSTKLFRSDDHTPIFMKLNVTSLPPGLVEEIDNPTETSNYPCKQPASSNSISHIVVNGNFSYTMENWNMLNVYNVTDKQFPSFALLFTKSPNYVRIFLEKNDKYLYAQGSTDDYQLYDVSDSSLPIFVKSIDSFNDLRSLYVDEKEYIYALTKTVGVEIADNSDRSNPSIISTTPISGSLHQARVVNDMLYLSTFTPSQFLIYNVTSRSSPKLIKKMTLPGNSDGRPGFEVVGNYAYISQNKDIGLTVIDIKNKTHPQIVYTLQDSYNYPYMGESFQVGGHLYIAAGSNGVRIFDIETNTSHPILLYTFQTKSARNVYVKENYIFVADDIFGFKIGEFGDITISGTPTKCGNFPVQLEVKDASGYFITELLIKVRSTDYFDDFCTVYQCYDRLSNISGGCAGHGSCTSENFCKCLPGYFSSTITGGVCDDFKCGRYYKDDYNACNDRGTCISSDKCSCSDDYEGDNCELFSCSSVDSTESSACSGHGICSRPDQCDCDVLYQGDRCQENLAFSTIVVPALAVAGVISIIIFIVLCFACICCCCFLIFSSCFVFCAMGTMLDAMGCCVFFQRFRLKKFSKLKNFDILLHEQKMEDDTSIAHLKINKNLFEINYDEIKPEKILGEGGSSSVVYLARWNKLKVAFKCFKTRMICSEQDSFDEFEREIEILSSVSHPFIIRFYGACLKPPRVGILMEFCEKGDLIKVITDWKKEDVIFPFYEKIRMIIEIATGLEYLHTRLILHRDIKCENVLLDSSLSCKLMDFGLSRIVDDMDRMKTKKVGTSIYMSPEVFNSNKYDERADVFSFSILMFILITENHLPYGGASDVERKVASDPNYRPDISLLEKKTPEKHLEIVKDVISKSWDLDPKERYDLKKIIKLFSFSEKECGDKFNEKEEDEEEIVLSVGEKDGKKEGSEGEIESLRNVYEKYQELLENVKKYCEINGISIDEITTE